MITIDIVYKYNGQILHNYKKVIDIRDFKTFPQPGQIFKQSKPGKFGHIEIITYKIHLVTITPNSITCDCKIDLLEKF